MYWAKTIIIAFILILITLGIAVWANTTELNLSQKIKASKIETFEACANAGYPIQESYPRKCAVPGGKAFTEVLPEDKYPQSSGGLIF